MTRSLFHRIFISFESVLTTLGRGGIYRARPALDRVKPLGFDCRLAGISAKEFVEHATGFSRLPADCPHRSITV
jgi:hypothetical protein